MKWGIHLDRQWGFTALAAALTLAGILTAAPFAALALNLDFALQRLLFNSAAGGRHASPRRRVRVPLFIETRLEEPLKTRAFDLSETGIFIALDLLRLPSLQPGRRVNLKLIINALHVVECEAEVVRVSAAAGGYPAGAGLRFVRADRQTRAHLQSLAA